MSTRIWHKSRNARWYLELNKFGIWFGAMLFCLLTFFNSIVHTICTQRGTTGVIWRSDTKRFCEKFIYLQNRFTHFFILGFVRRLDILASFYFKTIKRNHGDIFGYFFNPLFLFSSSITSTSNLLSHYKILSVKTRAKYLFLTSF